MPVYDSITEVADLIIYFADNAEEASSAVKFVNIHATERKIDDEAESYDEFDHQAALDALQLERAKITMQVPLQERTRKHAELARREEKLKDALKAKASKEQKKKNSFDVVAYPLAFFHKTSNVARPHWTLHGAWIQAMCLTLLGIMPIRDLQDFAVRTKAATGSGTVPDLTGLINEYNTEDVGGAPFINEEIDKAVRNEEVDVRAYTHVFGNLTMCKNIHFYKADSGEAVTDLSFHDVGKKLEQLSNSHPLAKTSMLASGCYIREDKDDRTIRNWNDYFLAKAESKSWEMLDFLISILIGEKVVFGDQKGVHNRLVRLLQLQ